MLAVKSVEDEEMPECVRNTCGVLKAVARAPLLRKERFEGVLFDVENRERNFRWATINRTNRYMYRRAQKSA